MPIWLQILIPVCSSVIAATILGALNGAKKGGEEQHARRKAKALAEEKAHLQELFDEFSKPILTKLNEAEITRTTVDRNLNQKLDNLQKDVSNVANGTKENLKNNLKSLYDLCADRGWRNETDTKTFNDMYVSYTALNGNTFVVEELYPAFHSIPLVTKAQEDKIKYEERTKKEHLDSSILAVIEKSANCPYNKKESKN